MENSENLANQILSATPDGKPNGGMTPVQWPTAKDGGAKGGAAPAPEAEKTPAPEKEKAPSPLAEVGNQIKEAVQEGSREAGNAVTAGENQIGEAANIKAEPLAQAPVKGDLFEDEVKAERASMKQPPAAPTKDNVAAAGFKEAVAKMSQEGQGKPMLARYISLGDQGQQKQAVLERAA